MVTDAGGEDSPGTNIDRYSVSRSVICTRIGDACVFFAFLGEILGSFDLSFIAAARSFTPSSSSVKLRAFIIVDVKSVTKRCNPWFLLKLSRNSSLYCSHMLLAR